MIIECKALKKAYGKHIVLDDFNFHAESKRLYCLYGPSGSGKTTLINIIGQLEKYDSGKILYDGNLISTSRQRRYFLRNQCGFMFQDFGLMENETVFTNLKILYRFDRLRNCREVMQNALLEVGLTDVLDRYVYELSGGEQQRVAFARILLKNSDLILADEPTANLDAQNKNVIIDLLQNLAKKGGCVIIASHDEDILRLADEKVYIAKHH